MNAILLGATGDEVEPRTVVPRRVRLPRAGIDRLAALAGVSSPAGQMQSSARTLEGLGERLGGCDRADERPVSPVSPVAATTDGDAELDARLASVGLVDAGVPTAQGRAVLTVWHAAALAVELELLVSLDSGEARVRSWHRTLDDWVVCLSTSDGRDFELGWLSVEDWWLELGRAVHVDICSLCPASDAAPVPDVLETPWELLLASGEAVQRRRHDLLHQLVSDHSGSTVAGADRDSLGAADDSDVRRWLEQLERTSRGRLHAAVMGRGRHGRPGAGIVEWVLLPDGWRSLTPVTRDGCTRVRIERTGAVDLPRALSVLAAEVTA
ncbi:hypothetical protein GCM10011376_30920 [Nocardioides flavus (ex Wang et al. 2016)]|uniref:EspG family protein n=1 Tax=Nocardioides flavus (ex Wang et al. 2016) TaxID=2058780 RepID=A0ABQ3HPU9_9ACTN|nr:hypothetical protein [Nocardioides flavus (ex Wang et al. 2016)]GHE18482.1 hypothetical protein GCM10011376_30920 [Nocardioides flavus (ex Wang et al. 2016)]